MAGKKILYLNSFTTPGEESTASDEVGHGITASRAIKEELRRFGHELFELPINRDDLGLSQTARSNAKLKWIHDCYRQLLSLDLDDYDAIFFFHIFHQFPCEVKRLLLDLGHSRIKLIGYTLGSHWDPTDTYRFIAHPGMQMADLGNLLCLDRILVVSDYFREVLIGNIAKFNREVADELRHKVAVVGLPIDPVYIDSFKTTKYPGAVTVVFNHAPIESKRPDEFFRVMDRVLAEHPIRLVVTRRFYPHSPGYCLLHDLCERYDDRIVLGNTLPLARYFVTLWQSDVQVSTAEHESLGISTLEAMYTYNCCLLPNRCSYPQIVGSTHEALYSSTEELMHKMHYFVSDVDQRRSVALKLRKRAEQYLPGNVVAKIHSAILDVLD